jgi:hypothetical protein
MRPELIQLHSAKNESPLKEVRVRESSLEDREANFLSVPAALPTR